jgi:hypothetical protein
MYRYPCLCCGNETETGSFNKSLRDYQQREYPDVRSDGKIARFCRDCRPAVNRVRMALRRQGLAVTWTAAQVALVIASCTARKHNRAHVPPSAV